MARHTYRVKAFTPDDAPKYLAVWAEDYPLTIDPSPDKQGYAIQGNTITVYYNLTAPIALFHLLMGQVVDYISHLQGLEAVYLAPPTERQFNPQPYNSLGWQGWKQDSRPNH
jgi:hypothetical protein